MCWIFEEYPYFCQFYYGNDRERNKAFTQICGPQQKISQQTHMLRTDIAASWLKILWENFDPVKSYDKTNITILALRLWAKYRWGLTSFGQFINLCMENINNPDKIPITGRFKHIISNTASKQQTIFEPTHRISALFVLRKFILQSRMCRHPVGLDVWFLVGPFVYFHTLCVRTAMALARLRECTGSPEPSLVAYAMST